MAIGCDLNAIILDFVARQKVQGQTLNLFIVEQLPVVPPSRTRPSASAQRQPVRFSERPSLN